MTNWTKARPSTSRAAAAKPSRFLPGGNILPTSSKAGSPRAKVAPALSQLLASYEADHNVKAEIPVIIQSNPDSYAVHGAPTGLAQAKALEQVHAHAGRMTVRQIRQLVEQGGADYITLDMPLQATSSTETVADDFDSGTDYTGNDGSVNWSDNWQEAGESDGSDDGLLQVVSDSYCASGSCLYLGDYNESSGGPWTLTRRADLSASTSATLSYHYGYEARSNEGFLKVQVPQRWRKLDDADHLRDRRRRRRQRRERQLRHLLSDRLRHRSTLSADSHRPAQLIEQ